MTLPATAERATTSVVVVNPTKLDAASASRAWLRRAAAAAGLPAPQWVETSAEDPGRGQAAAAVADGAGLVIAWGGDGTVRAVAEALAGTTVPLGIIPAGTGNLLARNLEIPLDLDAAVRVALTGADRTIDVLEVGLGGSVTTGVVIAGIGLDAAMMTAPEQLKARVGPAAYAVGLASALRRDRMRVGVSVDDGPPRWLWARTVLVANVGGLVGGLDVAPEAQPDDGCLDLVVLPLGSPLDWVRTAWSLARRSPGADSSRLHLSGSTARVVSRSTQPRQVDGDVVEDGSRLQVRVRPGALVVRVPAP